MSEPTEPSDPTESPDEEPDEATVEDEDAATPAEELAEDLADAGRALSGAVDAIIAELGDFLVDLVRTWGVITLRPWSAARLLMEDSAKHGGRYLSPSAFLVVSALTGALFSDGGPKADGAGASITHALQTLMAAAGGEAEAAWFVGTALVSGAVVFGFARGAAWLSPPDRREEAHKITTWMLSAPAFSILPLAIVSGLWGEAASWIMGTWCLVMAAPLALARWLWSSDLPWRRMRALVSFVGFWVFVAVWAGINKQMETQHEKVALEDQPVWFGRQGIREENGTYVIRGQLFNTSRKPWEACNLHFCDLSETEHQCVPATPTDDPPPWLVPGEAVYRTFSRPSWGPSRDAKLCCYEEDPDDPDSAEVGCLPGQPGDEEGEVLPPWSDERPPSALNAAPPPPRQPAGHLPPSDAVKEAADPGAGPG
jgi:hypothetical protein